MYCLFSKFTNHNDYAKVLVMNNSSKTRNIVNTKVKKLTILTLSILVIAIFAILFTWQRMPTSGLIFDKTNEYWQTRQFSRLISYMDNMNNTYSNYLPVVITDALIYTRHCKVDYEHSVNIQKKLDKCIKNNYVYIPYVLRDLLQGNLKRSIDNLASLNRYLLKSNISKKEYLKRLAPENQKTGIATMPFMYEVLFFNIPKAFITTNNVEYLSIPISLRKNFAFIPESEEKLKKVVFDYQGSMVDREKARNKLVVKRYQTGGITNLFQGFSTAEDGYMSLATAQKLYSMGEKSLPYIVEFLNTKKLRHTNSEMVLWTIMMIQYNGLSKEKTLEYVNQIDEYYFENSEYAHRIREFLNDND
jgi:hypothetical protein